MSALVASVVPWMSERTSAARLPASLRTLTRPCSTACEGSLGVVRSLPTWTAPVASSTQTRSVKVPPMSTPMRVRRGEVGVMAPECHGTPARARQRLVRIVHECRTYDRGGGRRGGGGGPRRGGGPAPGGRRGGAVRRGGGAARRAPPAARRAPAPPRASRVREYPG